MKKFMTSLRGNKIEKTKHVQFGHNKQRYLILFIIVFGCSAAVGHATTIGDITSHNLKRVLVLNSYHASYLWTKSIVRGIESEFNHTELKVLLSYEHMDTKHHHPDKIYELLTDLFSRKYANIQFDVIIALDNNALEFLLSYLKASYHPNCI